MIQREIIVKMGGEVSRARKRDRERERERERERKRERQTDRQTDRERQTDRQAECAGRYSIITEMSNPKMDD